MNILLAGSSKLSGSRHYATCGSYSNPRSTQVKIHCEHSIKHLMIISKSLNFTDIGDLLHLEKHEKIKYDDIDNNSAGGMEAPKKSSISEPQGEYIETVDLQSLEIGFGYAQHEYAEQIENKFIKELERLEDDSNTYDPLAFVDTIKHAEISKYFAVCKSLIKASPQLQRIQSISDMIAKKIAHIHEQNRLVYRVLDVVELEKIFENDGRIGTHYIESYGADMRFLSTTLNPYSFKKFYKNHSIIPLIVQFNTEPINDVEFQIVLHHARNDTRVEIIISGKKIRYRPDERFGGSHSVLLLSESEIHILVDSISWIPKVFIPLSQKTFTESKLQRCGCRTWKALW